MHVLGLPPAFVLSQDQTLKLKSCYQLILDVRTSAHSVPAGMTGTFSISKPVGGLDTVSVCCASGFIETESRQTVKLTIHYRISTEAPLLGSELYVQLFVHRMNQTAHISLQIPSISNSVETKSTEMRPNFWRAPPHLPQSFLPRFPLVWPAVAAPSFRLAFRCAPQRRR